MKKFFYEWEDRNDPLATGVPNLERYPWARATTKAAVLREWREYCATFKVERPNPKIRVWRIAYEEVKL